MENRVKFDGGRLREKRREAHLTQLELAEKAKLSLSGVIRYERNYRVPDANKLMNIAKVLNCEWEYFFAVNVSDKM